jgi:hypothetical protein
MVDDSSKHIPTQTTAQELEEKLLNSAADDSRLSSGVQPLPGNSDLRFINMSGLAEPVSEESEVITSDTPEVQYTHADTDPNAPLSFYEKGIDDVDAHMDPENIPETDSSEEPTHTHTQETASTSLEELQRIIAELSEVTITTDEAPIPTLSDIPLDDTAPLKKTAPDDHLTKSLEEASAALNDLSSPINTDFAETIADSIAADEDSPTPRTKGTPHSVVGYSLEEAELLLNELEAQDRDDPIPAESLDVHPDPIPPLSEIAPLAHADMSYEDVYNTIDPDSDSEESTLDEDHELLIEDYNTESSIGIIRIIVYFILLIGLIAASLYSYTQFMNTKYSLNEAPKAKSEPEAVDPDSTPGTDE